MRGDRDHVEGRVDEATRTIHALPSRIYRAFEDGAAMESWLPPKGMTGRMLAFDFGEGGHYRLRLTYAGDQRARGKSTESTDEVEVRFLGLIENQRIEQGVRFESEDAAFSGMMRVIWTFDEVLQGTRVTVRCVDVPEGIDPEEHAAGLASTLENLARYTESEETGFPAADPSADHLHGER